MGKITQYDIYWVDLDPTRGSEINKSRPCIIVSPDELNEHLRTIIICPLTSTMKGYPFRVSISLQGKRGEIAADQIRTIDKERIQKEGYLGHLSFDEINALQDVFSEMLCQ